MRNRKMRKTALRIQKYTELSIERRWPDNMKRHERDADLSREKNIIVEFFQSLVVDMWIIKFTKSANRITSSIQSAKPDPDVCR